MGKYYAHTSEYPYSWEQLAAAFWFRYPNPYSKHVLSEDTFHREVTEAGCLHTKRLLTKKNRLPKWAEFLTKARTVFIVEESYIDLHSRTITTYTKNVPHTKLLNVDEKCTYIPVDSSSHSSRSTVQPSQNNVCDARCSKSSGSCSSQCVKQAWMASEVPYSSRVSRWVEAFAYERYRRNASRAYKGHMWVLATRYTPDLAPPANNLSQWLPQGAEYQEAVREAMRRARCLGTARGTARL